jgi:hypothetical protein
MGPPAMAGPVVTTPTAWLLPLVRDTAKLTYKGVKNRAWARLLQATTQGPSDPSRAPSHEQGGSAQSFQGRNSDERPEWAVASSADAWWQGVGGFC